MTPKKTPAPAKKKAPPKKAAPKKAPVAAPPPVEYSDALQGYFAFIVEGEWTGLYGVVAEVFTDDEDNPTSAQFEVRTRSETGQRRPDTPSITVPWGSLRRAPAGLR